MAYWYPFRHNCTNDSHFSVKRLHEDNRIAQVVIMHPILVYSLITYVLGQEENAAAKKCHVEEEDFEVFVIHFQDLSEKSC